MSMHSLPRVGLMTGSSTDVPSTWTVAMDGSLPAVFWLADTLALLLGVPRRRGGRGRSGNQADRGSDAMRQLSHSGVRRKRRRPPCGGRRGVRSCSRLLGVALAELVDATAGVHQLVLAGVERMRSRGDFDLDQRIFIAVLPLHGLFAGERGTGEDLEVRGHVLEDDVAVFGMDVGLHGGHQSDRGKSGIIAGSRTARKPSGETIAYPRFVGRLVVAKQDPRPVRTPQLALPVDQRRATGGRMPQHDFDRALLRL